MKSNKKETNPKNAVPLSISIEIKTPKRTRTPINRGNQYSRKKEDATSSSRVQETLEDERIVNYNNKNNKFSLDREFNDQKVFHHRIPPCNSTSSNDDLAKSRNPPKSKKLIKNSLQNPQGISRDNFHGEVKSKRQLFLHKTVNEDQGGHSHKHGKVPHLISSLSGWNTGKVKKEYDPSMAESSGIRKCRDFDLNEPPPDEKIVYENKISVDGEFKDVIVNDVASINADHVKFKKPPNSKITPKKTPQPDHQQRRSSDYRKSEREALPDNVNSTPVVVNDSGNSNNLQAISNCVFDGKKNVNVIKGKRGRLGSKKVQKQEHDEDEIEVAETMMMMHHGRSKVQEHDADAIEAAETLMMMRHGRRPCPSMAESSSNRKCPEFDLNEPPPTN